MSQGHDGALMSPPNDQRPILAFELTVGSTSRVSDFTEHLPEYSVALTQAAAFAFTGTFGMAGTPAGPRGQLFTTAEALHINANLGDQPCRGDRIDARQCWLQPPLVLIGRHGGQNTLVEAPQRVF